ncbi:MAG: hypothetical protein JXB38_01210 [Anaerolineales bacterium]|nr:hypothetical protein [Anaerolineales bacterium]
MQRKLAMFNTLVWSVVAIGMIGVVGELFKNNRLWNFRVADFIDLVITAPIFIIMVVLIYTKLPQEEDHRFLRIVYMYAAGQLVYGHAMHLTANSINVFSTVVQGYVLPSDAYALIFFLDEKMSHVLAFSAAVVVFGCLLIADYQEPSSFDNQRYLSPFVWGLVCSIGFGFAILEGQALVLGLILIATIAILWFYLWKRRNQDLKQYLQTGPIIAFIFAVVPSTLGLLIIYRLIFGSFIEPLKLFI